MTNHVKLQDILPDMVHMALHTSLNTLNVSR
jgi:hypothetical protein